MITIKYGPWLPDLANTGFQIPDQQGPVTVPCADCLNVYHANGVYQSLPAPASIGSALPSQILGAYTVEDQTGNPLPFVGYSSGASWYASLGFGWTGLGISPLTTPTAWNFVKFGNQVYAQYATSNVTAAKYPALYQISVENAASPSSTANLITIAPSGNVMGVVGQFLMIGDIYVDPSATPATPTSIGTGNGVTTFFAGNLPTTQSPCFPTSVTVTAGSVTGYDDGNGNITGTGIVGGTVNYGNGIVTLTFTSAPTLGTAINVSACQLNRSRLHWCGIGNATNWPTVLTNPALAVQSGIQDLETEYGPIMFISGYPLYGVIFQKNAITRAQYIGGNVVFSWQTYARNIGLMARGAAVQVGDKTYFLSAQGFFHTDGADVYPIGTSQDNSAGIDQWFFSNVNKAAISTIRAGYDAQKRNVFFAIPTGSNTLPDTLLSYNVLSGYWTRSAVATEAIWTDSDGSSDRLGIIDQSHKYNLLTGTPVATSYLESMDLCFSDGLVRDTNGVRPNIAAASPTVTVGTRNTLQAAVTYNTPTAPDSFGAGFAPAMTEGLYTRIRVSAVNASSIQGATCEMVPGGPL